MNVHDGRVKIQESSHPMRARQIRFGEWIFEPGSCSVVRGQERFVLEPRVSDLLEFFLLNPDEVHSHDRLVDAVWHGQVVSDEAVRRAISVLRKAANGAFSPWIRTVYKRGYRSAFPGGQPVVPRDQATEKLIRDCDASLGHCISMPSPGALKSREALACLRSALELDPRLLEVLGSSGNPRRVG